LAHSVVDSNQVDFEELKEEREFHSLTPELRSARERSEATDRWPDTDGKTFTGISRRQAKTSYYEGSNHREFRTFSEFHSWLNEHRRDQNHMEGLHLPHTATSERVDEEEYNVTVTAYLYAAAKEADNDYHLVIGGGSRSTDQGKVNVEISGLRPRGMGGQELRDPREQFEQYCNDKWGRTPGRTYRFVDPPERVTISGSIFFDVDHGPGDVGPTDLRHDFDTSWEIHPIRDFVEVGN
jgi:hypothetical protein